MGETFSERLYLAYNRNHGIPVRIARYHNIFGPEGNTDGEEKARLQSAVSCYLPVEGGAVRCGEMVYKLVPSCSLTNALKQLED